MSIIPSVGNQNLTFPLNASSFGCLQPAAHACNISKDLQIPQQQKGKTEKKKLEKKEPAGDKEVRVKHESDGLPRYIGDISKAPSYVDPETRVDCSKITNKEIGKAI